MVCCRNLKHQFIFRVMQFHLSPFFKRAIKSGVKGFVEVNKTVQSRCLVGNNTLQSSARKSLLVYLFSFVRIYFHFLPWCPQCFDVLLIVTVKYSLVFTSNLTIQIAEEVVMTLQCSAKRLLNRILKRRCWYGTQFSIRWCIILKYFFFEFRTPREQKLVAGLVQG